MALVLVVDDETLIRLDAVGLMERAGHRTIEAANADEAIKILESRTDIEVVFSDVNMPGSMDGLRLLHMIRTRWPPIRLILASGNALMDMNLPIGAIFVNKPYEYRSVADAIEMAR